MLVVYDKILIVPINKKRSENQKGENRMVALDRKEVELVKQIVNAERDNLKSDVFVKRVRSGYEKALDNLVVKFK